MVSNISGSGTIIKYLGIIVILACILDALQNKSTIDIKWGITSAALLFLVYISVSVYFSKWFAASLVRMKMYYNLIAMFLILTASKFSINQVRKIINSIIASGVAISIYLFVNYDSLIIDGTARATITTDNYGDVDPNGLAVFLCISVIFAVDKFLNDCIKANKIILLFCNCCILFGIFVTGSRGGVMSSVTGVALMALNHLFRNNGQKNKATVRFISVCLIGILFLMTFSYLIPMELKERFDLNTWVFDGGSNRTLIWKTTIESVLDKYILFGSGVGTFPYTLYYHTGLFTVAHNIWLEVLVESGIIGFGIWMTFLGLIFKNAVKNKESTVIILLISIFIAESFLSAEVTKHFWNALMISMIYTKKIYSINNKAI